MKIFRPNCEAIILTLSQVFNDGSHLGKTLDKTLHSNKKLGAKDRHFIAQAVYEIVRYKRLFTHLSNQEYNSQNIDCNHVLGAYLLKNEVELPSWFNILEKDAEIIKYNLSEQADEKISQSYTDWFYEYGTKKFGTDWSLVSKQLNIPAEVFIRVNSCKTDKTKLQKKLTASGVQTELVPEVANALKIIGKHKLTALESFSNGEFEFQDISSQMVVEFCGAENAESIADICAGAGGKSLYLSETLNHKGSIFSFDIYENKLKTLTERAKKAGAKNIKTFLSDNPIKNDLKGRLDLVLIDSPCSGSGVIRRNPENKWNLTEDAIKTLTILQENILNANAGLVKRNGVLVYATCSIIAEENEKIIQEFLKGNQEFELIAEKKLVPGLSTNYDGFYMAKMVRRA